MPLRRLLAHELDSIPRCCGLDHDVSRLVHETGTVRESPEHDPSLSRSQVYEIGHTEAGAISHAWQSRRSETPLSFAQVFDLGLDVARSGAGEEVVGLAPQAQ